MNSRGLCELCEEQPFAMRNLNINKYLCLDCLMEIHECVDAQEAYPDHGSVSDGSE
jgi:hypothetical protein